MTYLMKIFVVQNFLPALLLYDPKETELNCKGTKSESKRFYSYN